MSREASPARREAEATPIESNVEEADGDQPAGLVGLPSRLLFSRPDWDAVAEGLRSA